MSGVSLKDNGEITQPIRQKKYSDGDVDNSSSFESQWLQYDEVDALPPSLRFNFFDIACILLSIGTYTFDLGMDLFIAYIYYTREYLLYFILTLIFVIIPAGTMTAFSLRWYVLDMDSQTTSKPDCVKWIIRTIFLLLQLAPVLRYIDSLIYGLKSRRAAARGDKAQQVKYYTSMVNEDADSTLLRLFEGFMESAPQVTLQIYILIFHFRDPSGPFAGSSHVSFLCGASILPSEPNERSVTLQVLAVFSSLMSLAWSLSSYHRSLRYSQPDKPNITFKGTILQFIWHLCSISARVFALGVFAATYPILIVPVCVAHWFAMLAWLIVQGNQACSNQCEETLFNLVVAFIYIFTFFNIRDEPTRYKYLTFYLICFLENTILLFMWFFSSSITTPEVLWFRVFGIVGDYSLFFLGIFSMVLYYVYFHPSLCSGSKLNSLQKEVTTATEVSEPRTIRTEFLTRKCSLDQGQSGLSNPISTASSRRNVTFAVDIGTSYQKMHRRSHSCDVVERQSKDNQNLPVADNLSDISRMKSYETQTTPL